MEVLDVKVISEGWRPISNYEYSDYYYDFVTPDEISLWVRGRRFMELVRKDIINNPGTARARENLTRGHNKR